MSGKNDQKYHMENCGFNTFSGMSSARKKRERKNQRNK